MTQKTDLAEVILRQAERLFREQGYAATSIKQIANAAGCTTAALYYHYEGGKSHILREVIQSLRQPADVLATAQYAQNLPEFLSRLTAALAENLPTITDQMSWLLIQFPTLPETEKRILQDRLLNIQASIRGEIGRFLPDETEADIVAWLVFCAFYGFSQISTKMELGPAIDLTLEDLGLYLAQVITQ